MSIKLVDIPEMSLFRALADATRFIKEYPDKIGPRDGCGFVSSANDYSVYIYRTKSGMIVVRWNGGGL